MPEIGNIINAGILLSCLSALLLIGFNRNQKKEQYMLAFIFLVLSWYAFFQPQRVYSLMSAYPFILRIGVPFYYLVPPFILGYTYIKLYGQLPKNKYVVLHLLPSFIGLLDISWYYIRDYDHLHNIALSVAQNFSNLFKIAEGFLPALVHYILRPLHGCIYCILSCYLCYISYKRGVLQRLAISTRVWLIFFNVVLAIMYLVLFDLTILDPPEDYELSGYYTEWGPATIIIFLFCSLGAAFLFYSPLLYRNKKGN